jgi:hypothetical protein
MKYASFFFLSFLLFACDSPASDSSAPSTSEETTVKPILRTIDFGFEQHIQSPEADSLLVDMMVYIYRKPDGVAWDQRFDNKYRGYYTARISLFEHAYLHKKEDGSFLYFILRPGRQENNRTVRGAGGMMTLENGSIVDFEETFNTGIGSREEILDIGYQILIEWAETGSWERFAQDRNYIEWPDDRLKYDKVRHEWRYEE